MTPTGTTTLNLIRDEVHRGWVCYDAECRLCRRSAGRFEAMLVRYHFKLVPLQASWVQTCLGLKPSAPLEEFKLITADGRVFGGADAMVQITRKIWWLWPLFALSQIPGAMILLRANYRWIAANRHCLGGACVKKKTASHRHTAFFEL